MRVKSVIEIIYNSVRCKTHLCIRPVACYLRYAAWKDVKDIYVRFSDRVIGHCRSNSSEYKTVQVRGTGLSHASFRCAKLLKHLTCVVHVWLHVTQFF